MNEPEAAKGFPGYYEIPGFSKYAINVNGIVVHKVSARIYNGNTRTEGYITFSMQHDCGKQMTVGRHRALGLAFKHPDEDIVKLVVNHLNGIPGNDWLGNLEWTTHQGNIEHAGAMGLTTKCVPISVRDVDTGEIVKYPSATAYAKVTNLSKDAVLWRLRVGEERVFPERKQYRKGHSDELWHEPSRRDERHGRARRAMLRYIKTDQVFEFEKLSDMAKYLGVKLPYLFIHTNNPDQPVLPGLIQVKWSDDLDWRYVNDPQLELDATTGNKSVVVVHETTGVRSIYDSATDCANALGLLKTTLSNRLKSDGKKIYDGYRFCLYSRAI